MSSGTSGFVVRLRIQLHRDLCDLSFSIDGLQTKPKLTTAVAPSSSCLLQSPIENSSAIAIRMSSYILSVETIGILSLQPWAHFSAAYFWHPHNFVT